MDSLTRQIESLPPEAQKLVSDLVALLSQQYRDRAKPIRKSRQPRRTKLAEERFVGMWADREDMADSVQYVRELRKREWANQ